MPPKGFKKSQDPFEDLDEAFKDAVASSSPADINKRITEVAKAQEENLRLMREDQDLVEKKAEVAKLGEPYKQATKENAQRVYCAMQVLADKSFIKPGTTDDLNGYIATVTKAQEENLAAQDADEKLASAKDLASEAAGQYKDATKMNRLRVRYCIRVLHDKGAV